MNDRLKVFCWYQQISYQSSLDTIYSSGEQFIPSISKSLKYYEKPQPPCTILYMCGMAQK